MGAGPGPEAEGVDRGADERGQGQQLDERDGHDLAPPAPAGAPGKLCAQGHEHYGHQCVGERAQGEGGPHRQEVRPVERSQADLPQHEGGHQRVGYGELEDAKGLPGAAAPGHRQHRVAQDPDQQVAEHHHQRLYVQARFRVRLALEERAALDVEQVGHRDAEVSGVEDDAAEDGGGDGLVGGADGAAAGEQQHAQDAEHDQEDQGDEPYLAPRDVAVVDLDQQERRHQQVHADAGEGLEAERLVALEQRAEAHHEQQRQQDVVEDLAGVVQHGAGEALPVRAPARPGLPDRVPACDGGAGGRNTPALRGSRAGRSPKRRLVTMLRTFGYAAATPRIPRRTCRASRWAAGSCSPPSRRGSLCRPDRGAHRRPAAAWRRCRSRCAAPRGCRRRC